MKEMAIYFQRICCLKYTPTPVLDTVQIDDPNEREKGIFKMLESYQKI